MSLLQPPKISQPILETEHLKWWWFLLLSGNKTISRHRWIGLIGPIGLIGLISHLGALKISGDLLQFCWIRIWNADIYSNRQNREITTAPAPSRSACRSVPKQGKPMTWQAGMKMTRSSHRYHWWLNCWKDTGFVFLRWSEVSFALPLLFSSGFETNNIMIQGPDF